MGRVRWSPRGRRNATVVYCTRVGVIQYTSVCWRHLSCYRRRHDIASPLAHLVEEVELVLVHARHRSIDASAR